MTDNLSTINLFALITETMPWFLIAMAIISGIVALGMGCLFLVIRKLDHNLRDIFYELRTLKSRIEAKEL